MVTVWLHSRPLGFVKVPLDTVATDEDRATVVWRALGERIAGHLSTDNLPVPTRLTKAGWPELGVTPCLCRLARNIEEAPLVSVIICTRERADQLTACLQSVKSLDYPAYEVIVIDNAPVTTATIDAVKRLQVEMPNLRYVREDYPGLSWARNSGLAQARGDIVAFTDDDVIVDQRWLSHLVLDGLGDERVGCATGLTLPAELETPAQVLFEQVGGFRKGFDRRRFDLTSNRPDHPLYPYASGMFGSGVNMAVRTALLRELGGFRPVLGAGSPTHGGEDLYLYFQIIMRGHGLVYEPSAAVYHYHRREKEALEKQIFGWGVGFTAYMLECLSEDPRRILDVMRRIPASLMHIARTKSLRNYEKDVQFPRRLTMREYLGYSVGPVQYWKSRSEVRRRLRPQSHP